MNHKYKPYLLCEIANVHGGELDNLRRLVSEFGCLPYERKGIKFQVFKYDRIALPDFQWFQVYQELYFDPVQWGEVILQASALGDVWIDVFDTYGVEVFSANFDLVVGVKLQASILQNKEVFEALAALDMSDKRLIINVSGFGLNDVALFVERFACTGANIILQVGYQAYPTAVEDTALQKIPVLRKAFPNHELCIADHADATTEFSLRAPVYGVLLGCGYVEKHMCLSREDSRYDKYSALEPEQLRALCQSIDEVVNATSGLFISTAEEKYLASTVQIPVLKHSMQEGALLSSSDFIYRRTSGLGLSADEITSVQESRSVLRRNKGELECVAKGDYKSAKIAVVVACRMKSSRLLKKAILPISGVASVARCLAQCVAVSGVDDVVLATSTLPEDDVLEKYTLGDQVHLWRGDPDDVIDRYLGACDHYGIDVVVRVTADCPLVVPDILEYLLNSHFSSGADYTCATDCAVGSSGEIINASALRHVKACLGEARYSEYMTWYFQNNKDVFKVNMVDLPGEYLRGYRMTLDYPEDLKMFERFFDVCEKTGGKGEAKRASQIFEILDAHPEITSINSHLTLKYRTDQTLIDLLNEKTRIIKKV